MPAPLKNRIGSSPDTCWPGSIPARLITRQAAERVASLLGLGVTFFLDLTSPADYLLPYEPHLTQEPAASGCTPVRVNLPIRDFDVPTRGRMKRILDTLDAGLGEGHTVYVHCWGGSGRTGTVIGCYLVRHGMPGKLALQEIDRLRAVIPPDLRRASPETEAQRKMVLNWRIGA